MISKTCQPTATDCISVAITVNSRAELVQREVRIGKRNQRLALLALADRPLPSTLPQDRSSSRMRLQLSSSEENFPLQFHGRIPYIVVYGL